MNINKMVMVFSLILVIIFSIMSSTSEEERLYVNSTNKSLFNTEDDIRVESKTEIENGNKNINVVHLMTDLNKDLYTPKFESVIKHKPKQERKANKEDIEILQDLLRHRNLDSEFIEALNRLNPYFSSKDEIFVDGDGLDLCYGVTQINLKLIPLAKMYYSDFETNSKSQFLFLDFYIKTKKSKGKDLNDIINSYKYCIYN